MGQAVCGEILCHAIIQPIEQSGILPRLTTHTVLCIARTRRPVPRRCTHCVMLYLDIL